MSRLKEFRKWVTDVWYGRFEYPESVFEFYERSLFWRQVKHPLCSPQSYYANVVYLLWGDLDCPCCAFHRGLLLGVILTLGVIWIV